MLQLPNHYDHVYIICFPTGTGGHFLANCLGLAEDFVFLNAGLAKQQIAGKFGLEQKIQYLHDKLSESARTKLWRDLDLRNGDFFGINTTEALRTFPEILSLRFDAVVNETIDANKKFCWTTHNILDVPMLKEQLWPRAKVIFFQDYQNFLSTRVGHNKSGRGGHPPSVDHASRSELDAYWEIVRGETWPQEPPSNMEQFRQLPVHIQEELQETFRFEIGKLLCCDDEFDKAWQDRVSILSDRYQADSFIWHVDENYSQEEKLLSALSLICEKFALPSLPALPITGYFRSWRQIIADCTDP
jgi:hypothetical protein